MEKSNSSRVCPVENAGFLDLKLRRRFHDPAKILKGLIQEGNVVLDFGCGPGFFTVDAAQLVGDSGKVIAADLQEGMLEKLRKRISGSSLNSTITLHKCSEDRIALSTQVDFILVFYVLHEVPSQDKFFNEIKDILKPGGKLLLVEPKFHVKKKDFYASVEKAKLSGLKVTGSRKVFFSRGVLFEK